MTKDISFKKNKSYDFAIGEAFPANSDVALFITRLCIISNELTLITKALGQAYDGKFESLAGSRLYFFTLACSHYRESAKILSKEFVKNEILTFLQDLDDNSRRRLTRIVDSFTPWQGSFVDSKLKPLRDNIFHYITEESMCEGLQQTLALQGRINFGQEFKSLEIRYEFADEVMLSVIKPFFGNSKEEIKATFAKVFSLMLDLINFSHGATRHYLNKLPKNIKLNRSM